MKQEKRYSEAFKQEVVREYEAGTTIYRLRQKYGVGGYGTIKRWIAKYGCTGYQTELVVIQTVAESKSQSNESTYHTARKCFSRSCFGKPDAQYND